MMTAISVTAEHIAAGEAGSCRNCPVALAIRDACPGRRVAVLEFDVTIAAPGTWGDRAWLPGEAVRFIRDLDNGRPVSPFTFDLDIGGTSPIEHDRVKTQDEGQQR